MKKEISKKEAEENIESFFKKRDFSAEEVKKIKRLAMKFKIKLRDKRRNFCKSCLNKLEGKIRITKKHKTIICKSCSYKNKFKLK